MTSTATTISTLSPTQIHQIGLREMDRIEAEKLAIAHEGGFCGCGVLARIAEDEPEISARHLRSRSLTITATILRRCNRSCRNCLASFPDPR